MNEQKTIRPNFDREIPEWKGYISKCKKRVHLDNTEKLYDNKKRTFVEKFGSEAVFLSNLEICSKPKYILLAREPSLPQKGAETVCFFPLHLHYCVWKWLCGGNFNYYITDLAKGAMLVDVARKTENERYPVWLPLFEEELNLLKPEKIIFITHSNATQGLLQNLEKLGKSLKKPCTLNSLIHYSNRNPQISKEYNHFKIEKMGYLPAREAFEAELRNFAKVLKEHLNQDRCNVADDYYETLINASLHATQRKVFAVYRYCFEQLKLKGKIPHI